MTNFWSKSWNRLRGGHFEVTEKFPFWSHYYRRRYFPSDSLYLWKEQEFKIVEELRPLLKMKNKGGHTSTTFLNSCSFQRYRLLLPVQWLSLGKYLLYFWGSIYSCLIKSILQLVILKSYSQYSVQVNFRYFPNHPNTSSI